MDGGIPDSIRLEHKPCPLCQQAEDRQLFAGRDLLHDLPGTFTVVACTKCDLKRTSPRPTPDTIGYYYPSEYGAYLNTPVSGTSSDTGLKSRIIAFAKRIFETRAQVIPRLQAGRMLEIGSATGSFLQTMASQGWAVEGIEISEEAAAVARGLGHNVEVGPVETAEKGDQQFDLIVGWMVLEHLHDPLLALGKLRRWIKPTGKFVFSVPDSGGIEFRIFGPRWYALQLPTHLFHYDRASIQKLLAATGWRVVSIKHQRTLANLIASTGYWFRDKGWHATGQMLIDFPEKGGRIGALLLFPFAWIAAALGQTGRMTIWAEPI